MKWVRLIIIGTALLAALRIGASYLGLDSQCNGGCSTLHNFALSLPLIIVGLVSLGFTALFLVTDRTREFVVLARVNGVVAAILVGLMVALRSACDWCLVVDLSLVSLALGTFGRRYVGAVSSCTVFLLGMAVLGPAALASTGQNHPVLFRARPYESLAEQSEHSRYFVVFSDPECPHCKQMDERMRRIDRPPVRVFYRWRLLPSSGDRSIRAALTIEGLCRNDAAVGAEFRNLLYKETQPLTDQVLLADAQQLGVREQVQSLLSAPPAELLGAIAEDGMTSRDLGVTGVPTVFELQFPAQGVTYTRAILDSLPQ